MPTLKKRIDKLGIKYRTAADYRKIGELRIAKVDESQLQVVCLSKYHNYRRKVLP